MTKNYINRLNRLTSVFGLKIIDYNRSLLPDIENDRDFTLIYRKCQNFTMTSIERMYSLYNSIKYITKYQIPGDIVESGVWRGGSAMLVALTLLKNNDLKRKIFLYDTYEGMPSPQNEIDISFCGEAAVNICDEYAKKKLKWCYSSLEETKKNLCSTHYPFENFVFIKGKVEDTIPNIIPDQIALLRLDTDWYESTKHELNHLYPRLSRYGVLIIDDYGHWKGVQKATDEFLSRNNVQILLNRIDYTGRIGIKI